MQELLERITRWVNNCEKNRIRPWPFNSISRLKFRQSGHADFFTSLIEFFAVCYSTPVLVAEKKKNKRALVTSFAHFKGIFRKITQSAKFLRVPSVRASNNYVGTYYHMVVAFSWSFFSHPAPTSHFVIFMWCFHVERLSKSINSFLRYTYMFRFILFTRDTKLRDHYPSVHVFMIL